VTLADAIEGRRRDRGQPAADAEPPREQTATEQATPPRQPTAPASLFADQAFRLLFTAAAVSKVGTQISFVGLPLVAVIALHASPAEVGVLGVMQTIAFLLIGLPAGAWLDRVRRRPVMIAADLARALLLGSVPIAWALDALSMQQLWVVVLLSGVSTVFFDVGAQSYLPALVGRDRLLDANGKLASWDAGAGVAGPSAGGYLVALITAPGAIALDAASYLASAVLLARIRRPEPPPEQRGDRPMLDEIREGVGFVFRHPMLRPIAVTGALTNLAIIVVITMVPLMFERELGLSPAAIGTFFALGGLGVFLGSITARRLAARLGVGPTPWVLGIAAMPFSLLVAFVDRGALFWIVCAGWVVVTYRIGVSNVILVSFRQQITPDELLSRMNATMRFVMTGVMAVGAALAGVVGQLAGVRSALWVGAVVLALSWVPTLFSPLRRIRDFSDVPTDQKGGRS
jgi:predicted MFS family arabinose efflux permease